MLLLRRFLLLVFLGGILIPLRAQFGTRPQIINFSKSEYGASSQNWSIDQDSAGHLFVANNRGLLVYDGSWQLYELPGQQITRSVACGADGRIYTGAFGEFGYWEKQPMGRYVYHSLNRLIHYPQFAKEEIWKIMRVGQDIYFQSFSTLYRLHNNKIQPIKCPGNIMYAFPIRGNLYVQVLHDGLYRLDNTKLTQISPDPIFKKDEAISILDDGMGGLLIGTVHNGLFQLKENKISPLNESTNTILTAAQLNVALALPGKQYAVGTIQNGIYVIDAAGNIKEHFFQENGLQNNTILALKIDQNGNLWAGLDHGLDEVVLQSPFRYYIDNKGNIGAIYTAALYNGVLYVGSNHGLFYYDSQRAQYIPISGIKGQVWSLSVLNGQLLCSHNSGTAIIDNQIVTPLTDASGGWVIKPLASDSNYAFQGTYIGLAVYKKGLDGHYYYWKIVKGTENTPYSDWVEDSNGKIWLAHAYKGIACVSLNTEKDTITYDQPIKRENGLSSQYRYFLFLYHKKLFAVSPGGLLQWNATKKHFESADSLARQWGTWSYSKKIFTLPDQTLWFVKDDDQLAYSNSENQLTPNYLHDFNLVAGYENIIYLNKEFSFLCGENGFALFRSGRLQKTLSATPEINRIYVAQNEKYVSLYGNAKLNGDTWEIPYKERDIRIMAGISVYDRKVLYRFRLIKSNDVGDWSDWQSAPFRNYSNLTPGDYKMEVQTNVNAKTSQIKLSVLPPFYRTWWAELVYMLVIAFGLRALFRWIERRQNHTIERKNREMEEKLLIQKMHHERELLLLQQEKLENEVQMKSEDLANSASELIKRKKLLGKLYVELEKQKENRESPQMPLNMRKLSKELERQLKLEKDESKLFEQGFNTVHEKFFHILLEKYPQLTPQDLKLAAYLRMNLGSKEIAPLLSITVRGVELKRYRLRKKMNLSEDVNLNDFMMRF